MAVSSEKNNIKAKLMVPWILLAVFVAYLIFVIAFSVTSETVGLSLFASAVFVILEALLAALLFPVPLFVHGLVFLAQIGLGLAFQRLPMMIIMAIIYALSIILLWSWTRKQRA